MPFVHSQGLRTFYEEKGQGTPVLLFHGWGVDHEYFTTLANALASHGRKVISFDLPGFGKSDAPHRIWGVEEYASHFASIIAILQIHSMYVVGHSLGGALALCLAKQLPDEVKGIVLIEAAIFRHPLSLRKKIIRIITKLGKWILSHQALQKYGKHLRARWYRGLDSPDYPATSGRMRDVFLKIIRADLSPALMDTRLPTLILWGDADRSTPLRDGQRIREMIPNSILKIYPGRGHALPRELPDALARDINNFLQ